MTEEMHFKVKEPWGRPWRTSDSIEEFVLTRHQAVPQKNGVTVVVKKNEVRIVPPKEKKYLLNPVQELRQLEAKGEPLDARKKGTAAIASAVVTAVYTLFCAVPLGTRFPFLFLGGCIAVWLCTYIGVRLMNVRKPAAEQEKEDDFVKSLHDINKTDIENVIVGNLQKLDELGSLVLVLRALDSDIADLVAKIRGDADKVIRGFKKEPNELPFWRTFLRRVLDGTISISTQYVDYVQEAADDPAKIAETTQRFKTVLARTHDEFVSRMRKRSEGDRTQLEVELQVLDQHLNRP